MTTYTGTVIDFPQSEQRQATPYGPSDAFVRTEITSDYKYGGTYSLLIRPGGWYEVDYGTDSGTASVTVYVKFDSGTTPALEVWDGADSKGRATPTGGGTWERLKVSFAASPKVYTVRLCNYGPGDAWFDDLK